MSPQPRHWRFSRTEGPRGPRVTGVPLLEIPAGQLRLLARALVGTGHRLRARDSDGCAHADGVE